VHEQHSVVTENDDGTAHVYLSAVFHGTPSLVFLHPVNPDASFLPAAG
jgi:hypothetical protein